MCPSVAPAAIGCHRTGTERPQPWPRRQRDTQATRPCPGYPADREASCALRPIEVVQGGGPYIRAAARHISDRSGSMTGGARGPSRPGHARRWTPGPLADMGLPGYPVRSSEFWRFRRVAPEAPISWDHRATSLPTPRPRVRISSPAPHLLVDFARATTNGAAASRCGGHHASLRDALRVRIAGSSSCNPRGTSGCVSVGAPRARTQSPKRTSLRS